MDIACILLTTKSQTWRFRLPWVRLHLQFSLLLWCKIVIVMYKKNQMNVVWMNQFVESRFSVVVHREHYPVERPPPLTPSLSNLWLQPAHTVILLNALTVVNLLPLELTYSIKDVVRGRIRPGQQAAINQVSDSAKSSFITY